MGSIEDGMIRTADDFVDDFVEDWEDDVPTEYYMPGYIGVDRNLSPYGSEVGEPDEPDCD